MKKIYQAPAAYIMSVNVMNMMAASPGTKTGNTVGDEYNEGDVTYVRHRSIWDIDDED